MNGYEAAKFKDLAEQADKIRQGREHLFRDAVIERIYGLAEEIAGRTVHRGQVSLDWDRRLDDILTSRLLGFQIGRASCRETV